MDSIGGFPLALRYTDTNDEWRQFAGYRVVPANGNMVVTFALSGIGEVYLDDLGISSVVTTPQETAPTTPDSGGSNNRFLPNWIPTPF